MSAYNTAQVGAGDGYGVSAGGARGAQANDNRARRVIDNILLRKFSDGVPGVNYFTQARGVRDGTVIGIHFHNAKAVELEATSCSIFDMVAFLRDNNEVWTDRQVNILIIQDGSMNRYIKKSFPKMYYFSQQGAGGDIEDIGSVSDNEEG